MNIKLIWDFRGVDALKTAQHHTEHLSDFGKRENIRCTCGVDELTSMHSIAWIAVQEKDMLTVRDALIPHRGEEYQHEIE